MSRSGYASRKRLGEPEQRLTVGARDRTLGVALFGECNRSDVEILEVIGEASSSKPRIASGTRSSTSSSSSRCISHHKSGRMMNAASAVKPTSAASLRRTVPRSFRRGTGGSFIRGKSGAEGGLADPGEVLGKGPHPGEKVAYVRPADAHGCLHGIGNMLPVQLIRKKRDGGALDEAELRWFIGAVTDGSVPD